jgi:DHA3 family macrolide efflux protein-like MFS transporter
MSSPDTPRGTRTFLAIWVGQLVSLIGTGLTNFALGVWVYQRTGSATQLTIIYLFGALPAILTLPLAGALVDRWSNRRAMLFSNIGAGLSTLPLVLLLWFDRLEVWSICLIVVSRSFFMAFLNPAYTAAVVRLIPKEQFGRASGMMQASQAAAQIIPPLLAGVLVVTIGIHSIVLIDVCSYLFALVILLSISIPSLAKTAAPGDKKKSLLREAVYGWTYIRERPGLLALLIYFATVNFVLGIVQVLFTPLLLSFTSAQVLGTVLAVSGVGFLAGSVLMSIWGGPKNRVLGILGFGFLLGLSMMLSGVWASAPFIAATMFMVFFLAPFVNGCSEAIWLSKTMPEVQGRVFATRRMIGFSSLPLAYLLAGVLADKVFEPLLARGGPLSDSVGRIIGEGPGRGIGLLYIVAGVLTLLTPVISYLYPRLRKVEEELPDVMSGNALSRA